jgi:hypothetical protein
MSKEPIPFIALRMRFYHVLRENRDLSVSYLRQGILHRVNSVRKDSELSQPPTYCERKFLRFRSIPVGPNVCKH